MNSDLAQPPLSSEELVQRQKKVRKWVLLRGLLLGLILGAWWMLFAPDSLVEPPLKYILGVLVGMVATASYLFNLRETLFPKITLPAQNDPDQVEQKPGAAE